MCCKRKKLPRKSNCSSEEEERQEAGKCRSMEIDGGPPPFHGGTSESGGGGIQNHHDDSDDDAFNKNPFVDDGEDESSTSSSNLPLPQNPEFRSRSVSPAVKGDHSEEIQKPSSAPEAEEIQKTSEENDDDDDEWGDFGEAVSAAPAPIIPPLQMTQNDDDDDDEWGEFDQARPSTDSANPLGSAPNSSRSQDHQRSIEEWGSFDENPQKTNSADDEWQAEFSSSSTVTTTVPTVIPSGPPAENLKALEEMLEDEQFWDDGYSEGVEDSEDVVGKDSESPFDIPALFDSESLEQMSNEEFQNEKQKYSKLWLSLRVIEEAISLKFDWKQSEIKKNHFKALKIQPITVKKETRATAAAIFDTSNLLLPTPIQNSNSTTTSSSESPLQNHQESPKSSGNVPVEESPTVPAVDFDWDTSGLTNPMNRANQSSAIIDVDFLGSNGVATAYTSTLQQDLEQFGLNNGASGAGKMMTNGSSILETLMSRSTANGTSPRYRTPEVLSLDARQLLDRLPDLQYLQSEVLMFPIGTNLPH